MENPLNNLKRAELQRFLLMTIVVILQLLVFGARSYAQCDDLVGSKPLRAKMSKVVSHPIPWSSTRPRLGRSMVVGSDRRRGFVRHQSNGSTHGWEYNIKQIQSGRAITAGFVGFFMGHTVNSGGGIEGMNSLNVGASTVALCALIPYKGQKTRKDGFLKTFLAEVFVYSTCYALGHGIAQAITPDHSSIQ